MSNERSDHKRNMWLWIVSSLFLLAGIVWFLWWIFIGRFWVYTEDAYVTGNQVMLTPQVSAGVKAIYAEETDLVEEGQLVVELDPTEHQLVFEEKKMHLANTVRSVAQMFELVLEREASVALRRAELIQAQLDFAHRIGLVAAGAVSVESFQQYETNVDVAQAAFTLAERELESAKLRVANTTVETHPLVQEAVAEVKDAYLKVIRCQIWAPVRGYVAKRTVQVGDQVAVGSTLLYVVPLDYLWIEANYKETKLGRVRIGQPVYFTADIYGRGFDYHGHVVGFSPGTGSVFALLPPENASGNWIKIIQRVPVRVSIDPQDLRKCPLVTGLSTRVHVDVHNTDGPMLATVPTLEPLYTTEIYRNQIEQMEALDPVIEDLIACNKEVIPILENNVTN